MDLPHHERLAMIKNTMVPILISLLVAIGVGVYLRDATAMQWAAAMSLSFFLMLALTGLMVGQNQLLASGILLRYAGARWALPFVFWGAHQAYSLATGSWLWTSSVIWLAYLTAPWFVLHLQPRFVRWRVYLDFLVVFLVWLPFDMGWMKHVWLFPEDGGASYPLCAVTAVVYALLLFKGFRRLKGIGYQAQLSLAQLTEAMRLFGVFFAIAFVIGTATGFIAWNGNISPLKSIGYFLPILFFIAIPEEFLFRGILQNIIQQHTKDDSKAIAITAVLFGLTHLNNHPVGDWRYAFLATIAGVVYGYSFYRTKNLTAPALIHATVDAVWKGYFLP